MPLLLGVKNLDSLNMLLIDIYHNGNILLKKNLTHFYGLPMYSVREAHPWTSFWRSNDRSSELVWRSDDRSSELVWWGDDRSSDRRFLPMIAHRKKVPVIRAIIWKKYFRWSLIGRKCRSWERSSPHQTVSDDRSSEQSAGQKSNHLSIDDLPPTVFISMSSILVLERPFWQKIP